ncbi:MAG: sugar phosphate nucleotidyltransferase [Thermodesulfobacteriota bacterium]
MSRTAESSNRYVIIMAGGRGERFWPVSREKTPKQLIRLLGDRSFLQQAVDRVLPLVPWRNILIVTNAVQAPEVRRQLPKLPKENVIAEPVGSCTDLVATVSYPLRRLYGEEFTVAPVSVLVDPVRALRVFGLERGGSFSEKVIYVYLKQLEEADLIVLNKCDLLEPGRLASLRQAIAARFPHRQTLAVSARDGTNLEAWFARLTSQEQAAGTAMEVDYQTYAQGEALLGWLNGTAQLAAETAFEADQFLRQIGLFRLFKLKNGMAKRQEPYPTILEGPV